MVSAHMLSMTQKVRVGMGAKVKAVRLSSLLLLLPFLPAHQRFIICPYPCPDVPNARRAAPTHVNAQSPAQTGTLDTMSWMLFIYAASEPERTEA